MKTPRKMVNYVTVSIIGLTLQASCEYNLVSSLKGQTYGGSQSLLSKHNSIWEGSSNHCGKWIIENQYLQHVGTDWFNKLSKEWPFSDDSMDN